MSTDTKRPTVLAFNSVQRLLRGDFFHAVTTADIRAALSEFPSDWAAVGLGTTNWFDRNGEVIIGGSASEPRFLWADPLADRSCAIRDLEHSRFEGRLRSPSYADRDGVPSLPFAAAAAWGPESPSTSWSLYDGADIHSVIAEYCAEANVGLAAIRVTGPMRMVEYQSMRYLPLGGIATDRPPVPIVNRQGGAAWEVVGFYSHNPTVQALLGFEGVRVHLHGHADAIGTGGHVNAAIAAQGAEITAVPLEDLVLRIHGLDVATLPVRDVA